MLPLTRKIPKPLLRIGNKTILDYIFDALPAEVDQVIMVVGYLKKKILEQLGVKYQGRPIRYVTQEVLDGSATALLTCKEFFLPKERFLIVYGDELPTTAEIADCLAHEFSWLCTPAENPRQSGVVTTSPEGRVTGVVEKSENPPSTMSAAGIMVVNSDIFTYRPVQHENGEYYLTALMNEFLAEHSVQAVYGRMRPAFVSPDDMNKITLDQYGTLVYNI